MSKIFNLEFDGASKKISIIETVEADKNDTKLINCSLEILQQYQSTPKEYDWTLLENKLNEIFCQDDNLAIISKSIKTWLRSPVKDRPLVFFLAGTSGTGKTFTPEQVQKALEKNGYKYERIDMNSYKSEHQAQTFLGAPPSYVGYGTDSPIFRARRSSEKLVLLFDEIEKSHPSLFDIMMNLLDSGTLTSGSGDAFDFKNSIIFFTSNLAMDSLVAKKQELVNQNISIDSQIFQDAVKNIIKSHGIRNEISGRIKFLLVYNTLDAKHVAKIAIQEIRKLGKKYSLQINDIHSVLLKRIADDCKNNNEGARPVKRNVENDFEDVFQDFSGNKNDVFDIDNNKKLVKSSSNLFSIDEIVNKINFYDDEILFEDKASPRLMLPSKPFFEIGNNPDFYAKALGLIKIDNGQAGEGTGFLISSNGYILTCAHCVVSSKEISFNYNGEDIETSLIYKNEDLDIAILKIERENLPYFVISDSTRQLKRGTQMGLLAYPKGSKMGTQPSYTSGGISKYESGDYFTDAGATHGSSGGAFFKIDDGVVYGVLKGGFGAEGANINVATDIRTLFKQNDIEIEFE